MKYLIPVLCAVALLCGCVTNKPLAEAPKVVVAADQLEERDGLSYLPNEEKPFTGVAVEKYPNGQKEYEGTLKAGKWHGLLTMWYKNGQKEEELTFKADKKISRKEWDKDGNQTYPKP